MQPYMAFLIFWKPPGGGFQGGGHPIPHFKKSSTINFTKIFKQTYAKYHFNM